jgi:hypothetical protein
VHLEALSRIHSTVLGVATLIAWISVCAGGVPEPGRLEQQPQLLEPHARLGDPIADGALLSASGLPKAIRASARARIKFDGPLGDADDAHTAVDPSRAEAGPGRCRPAPIRLLAGHPDAGEHDFSMAEMSAPPRSTSLPCVGNTAA